jgi:hypothetical protein
MLTSLKIKHFMLPAAHEAESIWMNKFGFSRIPQEEVCYPTLPVILSFIVLGSDDMADGCKSDLNLLVAVGSLS